MTRYRPPTSAKQILVRDHNWALGNLQRVRNSLHGFDTDIKNQIRELIDMQHDRMQYQHEGRLMSITSGDPAGVAEVDPVLYNALVTAKRNRDILQKEQFRGEN